MAAPHVTGAWALLKSKKPDASVDEILDALRTTGKPIIDILSGASFPRIDIPAALAALDNPIKLTVIKAGGGSGGVTGMPAGIDCGSYCTKNFAGGTIVTLTAKPVDGSTFVGWSGSSEACSGTGGCTVKMSSAKSITATFGTAPSNKRVLGVVVKGQGSVTSKPAGISCGSQCSASFNKGAKVTLKATPAEGFIFKAWSGACQGVKSCSVTMGKNKQVSAQFVRQQ